MWSIVNCTKTRDLQSKRKNIHSAERISQKIIVSFFFPVPQKDGMVTPDRAYAEYLNLINCARPSDAKPPHKSITYVRLSSINRS
jgi:hypothetical protein